jgi:ABC-type multidrug transport system ATPase subunit
VVPLLSVDAGFNDALTGRANIYLNCAIYGLSRSVVDERVNEIIEFADIGDFIDVPVAKYSSGMYLRLAFSVAVNMNPDILLADEVLAVGDADFQERCLERVKQAGRDGMTVLFVSQDMTAVTRLCDRVLWLNAGEVIKIGDPEEVVSEYQNQAWSFTEQRLARTKRRGRHRNDYGELVFVRLTSADGSEVSTVQRSDEVRITIGIRVDRADVTVRFVVHVHQAATLAFRAASDFFAIERAGTYAAVLTIPANLLADTMYALNVEAIVVAAGGAKYPLAALNALSFRVLDPSAQPRDRAAGVVLPHAEWSFEAAQVPKAELTTNSTEAGSGF